MPGNVVLIGFSGTGKSQVGSRLARRLGREFIDTDERLVARFRMTIGEYFRRYGEAAFREAESEEVAAACRADRAVVSLGGGAVVLPSNLSAARSGNFVVRLRASADTIFRRLSESAGAEERPMLSGPDPQGRIRALLAEREPVYRQADAQVDTEGRTTEEIVDEVACLVAHHEGVDSDPYQVAPGLLDSAGRVLRHFGVDGRAFVVTDENVGRHHGQRLMASLDREGYRPSLRAVLGVEASKSLEIATTLYEWLADERAERRDFVVALGGGVVGDLAGFVAATYLRGMPLIQVPTTLLAQVDSAIGGKAAVNLRRAKNLVGAWHLPRAILVDPLVLSTLPRREVVSGWTETIKHALLMDEELLEELERSADALLAVEPEATAEVVRRSGRLKIGVVQEDPQEQGRRIILNYGHTIGHALEAATEYGRLLHGEAVAVGMTGAAMIGQAVGVTPASLVERQTALLTRFGLSLRARGVDRNRVRAAMWLDKKVDARAIRWVLLAAVGETTVRRDVPENVVESVLTEVTS